MARRPLNVFSLSFLDAMTCGLGAVVLLFMVINAAAGVRQQEQTSDRRAEVDLLQDEVLDGFRDLVETRNTVADIDDRTVTARGLATRLLEELQRIEAELATFDKDTLARQEHVNRLQADLKSLEEDARRLSAAAPSDENPGDRLRSFVGDGDRQYLTGLKVGGQRIAVLVDASASMLDSTVVNVLRRRNMSEAARKQSPKWRQAVATVDWLSTRFPRTSRFQIYTFAETAEPVVPDTDGKWLDAGSRDDLEQAVASLRNTIPAGGTNLYAGLEAVRTLSPLPDNIILLVDGLPTRGERPPRRRTINGEQRLDLFNKAVPLFPRGVPVNVILFPMEGDPLAAGAWWKVALGTGGSFLSPTRDWP